VVAELGRPGRDLCERGKTKTLLEKNLRWKLLRVRGMGVLIFLKYTITPLGVGGG